jgi:hypothetical protein
MLKLKAIKDIARRILDDLMHSFSQRGGCTLKPQSVGLPMIVEMSLSALIKYWPLSGHMRVA